MQLLVCGDGKFWVIVTRFYLLFFFELRVLHSRRAPCHSAMEEPLSSGVHLCICFCGDAGD